MSRRQFPADGVGDERGVDNLDLVMAAPVGIFVSSPEGRYLLANETMAGLFGYDSPEDLIESVTDIANQVYVDPADREHMKRALVAHGEVKGHECLRKRKDGSVFWASTNSRAVRGDDGEILHFQGFTSDITERKLAEKALRESEERFRLLYQDAPVAYQSLDSNGMFIEVNRHFCETLGYTAEELIGTSFADLLHPDWCAHFEENFPRFKAVGEVLGVEFQMRKRNGEYILVSFTGRIGRNPDGKFRQTHCVFRDITREHAAEEALRERERYLSSILETTQDGFCVIDSAGVIHSVNDALCRMTGYDRPELLLSNLFDLEAVDPSQGLAERIANIALAGSGLFQTRHRRRDGTFFDVEISVSFLDEPSDRFVCFCRDISERKRAEEHLKTILEATNDGIWDYDLVTGRLRYSDRWAEMLGYRPDELVDPGCYCEHNAHPDDLERFKKLFTDYVEGRADKYETELRMRTKDGSYKWIYTRGRALGRDASGRALRMVGAHTDISERKQVEEELIRQKMLTDAIFDSVPGLLYLYDDQGRLIRWNKQHELLTGYSSEELRSMDLMTWYKGDVQTQARIAEAVGVAMRDGYSSVEAELQTKDGERIPFYFTAVRLTIDGKTYFTGVGIDITDRKRFEDAMLTAKEQAEAASRAKSSFLANMSHELRTPLNGIMGMIQLMQMTALDAEQADYARTAIESSKRLTRLLSDILDISRIEADKLAIVIEPFDLHEVLATVEQLFQTSAAQSGNSLEFNVAPGVPKVFMGDALRLQQVLSNFVGNALKFTRYGVVEVDVHPLPPVKPGQYRVLFSISDTGQGIPDNKQASLFQPFTQVEEGITRGHQGAGLGLSICKHLASLMGGNLAIASELDVGTTVYFSLGFDLGESPEETVAGENPESDPVSCRPFRILLAEDERVNQVVVRKFLEKHGHILATADDGRQALRSLRGEHFDVVLMDVQMPVMDGVEAAKAIRAGKAGVDKADIPIIALTAHVMEGDRDRFLEAGMDHYLAKPVVMYELLAALQRVVKKN
jgi:PAS domain S-box-containing protein